MIGARTGIKNEGWALQVEREGDSIGTDGDTLSDTIMIVDFVTVILQLGGGGEKLTEINAGIGATVVDPRVNQCLGPCVSTW